MSRSSTLSIIERFYSEVRMAKQTVEKFAASAEGRTFFRAYDRALDTWPSGTTSTDLESPFGTTHVLSSGPVDGPVVIALPGAGTTATVWGGVATACSSRYRVHALDLMGDAGRSVARGRAIASVDDLVEWLDGVLDALNVESARLVAHSYGAMVALAYALRRAHRVTDLVLLDPNSCFAGMRGSYLMRALPILLRPTERRERAFLEWETGGRLDELWASLIAGGTAHFPSTRPVIPKRPTAAALTDLDVPMTVVLARDSRVHHVDAVQRGVRATVPYAHTVMLDDATHHMMPLEPAADIAAAVLDALARPAER